MIQRMILFCTAALLPGHALAHAGHLGELAGHSHWVGAAALAGAVMVAGVIALKDRNKRKSGKPEEAETTKDGEEAAGEAA